VAAVPNVDDTNFVTSNGSLVVSGERFHFTGDGSDDTGLGAIVSSDYSRNERVVKPDLDSYTVDNDPGDAETKTSLMWMNYLNQNVEKITLCSFILLMEAEC